MPLIASCLTVVVGHIPNTQLSTQWHVCVITPCSSPRAIIASSRGNPLILVVYVSLDEIWTEGGGFALGDHTSRQRSIIREDRRYAKGRLKVKPIKIASAQRNLTSHRCRTWTVQSYSPGCTNVHPHLTHASLGPYPSPQLKRHLDRFSHFCRAHN